MNKLLLPITICSLCHITAQADYTQYVNPLMGTLSSFELSSGNTYPAIAMPWGMNCWTPQTRHNGDGWQYVYSDLEINGFKQTHQPSPWINDYGCFSIMPMTGKPEYDEDMRASWYSHKGETATPYYYSVYLASYDIFAEIAPTERAAMLRFTFPECDSSYILIDAFNGGSQVTIIPDENKITGYSSFNNGGVPENFRNYFIIEFDKPFSYTATVANDTLHSGTRHQIADHACAIVGFSTHRGEQVNVRVASSFISHEQAQLNMDELGNMQLDDIALNGKARWNEVLGRIDVDGGTTDQLRTFYSCLYRSLLFPRKFYEIQPDGSPVHYSPYNGQVLPGFMYTDTGFWDTFRSLFPLLNLMYPSVNKEIQEGLLNAYRESGFFPEWASPGHRGCMVGNNSASVLADAYIKGIKVDDIVTLYNGLQHGTRNVHPTVSSTGRLGHEYYNKLGYVPCNVGIAESAARTLEYAYNDWCILQVARAINRPSAEIAELEKRAMNYRNLFDHSTHLMRGRLENGKFQTPFSPLKWGDAFTEGNSWHYTWSVFHDVQGLVDLMGGDDAFVAKLDSVFSIPPAYDDSYYGFPIHEIREMAVMNMGNYAHGNQPIQHIIYLYNYAGRPWTAQQRLREVMEKLYAPTPDGYCGDEDNGQTSAWYVFSALGFYPVCPGTDQYVAGSPLFKRATLHFENGNTFTINAPSNNSQNIYIHSATLNGKEYSKTYYSHTDLQKGGTLQLNMQAAPNKQRGIAATDRPYSFSTENNIKQNTN